MKIKSLKEKIVAIRESQAKFSAEHPAASAPTLLTPKYCDIESLLKQLDAFIDSYNGYIDQQHNKGESYINLDNEINLLLQKIENAIKQK